MQQPLFIPSTAEIKFEQFHTDNPHVYSQLVNLARQYRERRPYGKIGIKLLFEIVRWHTLIHTTDKDFKINNNYAPRYARLIMDNEPDLADIFNLRELKS
jgi:hypothetical protein